jgi:hypothetical protein
MARNHEGHRMAWGDEDARAIAALIRRQFASLAWAPGRGGDWDGFARDFLPGAPLFPSARPVQPQTVPQFVARMQGLARGALHTFDERVLGIQTSAFGNVAVALAACEMTENGSTVSRNVEALLLVKDGGTWKIAAQGWDRASAERPVPADLASGEGGPLMVQSDEDARAIDAVIRRQIASLAWSPEREGDWDGFARDFAPGASLIQSPRPVEPRTVPQFVARQQGLARDWLRSYGQRLLGTQSSVFGAVAVALAAAEMSENGAAVARNVAALLLIKDSGAWKIAAQAWDRASEEHPVPRDLGGSR